MPEQNPEPRPRSIAERTGFDPNERGAALSESAGGGISHALRGELPKPGPSHTVTEAERDTKALMDMSPEERGRQRARADMVRAENGLPASTIGRPVTAERTPPPPKPFISDETRAAVKAEREAKEQAARDRLNRVARQVTEEVDHQGNPVN